MSATPIAANGMSVASVGSTDFPFQVAIVGAGPAGIFATESILKQIPDAKVTVIDALPTPYGLVRSGVAPDHFKIKEVQRGFEKTLSSASVTFIGNVKVGSDIGIRELLDHYHAVILSHGAARDRSLGIPGENLKNSETATSFVGWYNAHPWFENCNFDLSGEKAIIIGQGNVALDVARVMLKDPELLESTDIGTHAIECLKNSKLKEVHLIGRRGPLQMACTDKELAEFGEIPGVSIVVRSEDLFLSVEEEVWLASAPKSTKRNYDILKSYSERDAVPGHRKLYFHFFLSPASIEGGEKVESIRCTVNKLIGPIDARKAEPTEEHKDIPCDLILRSVGYFGEGISDIPFDTSKGVYFNTMGRIVAEGESALEFPNGLYTSGWIKRGPSGVIGTNKADSVETVRSMVDDLSILKTKKLQDANHFWATKRKLGVRTTSWEDWKKIESLEKKAGELEGKSSKKFRTVREMLDAIDALQQG